MSGSPLILLCIHCQFALLDTVVVSLKLSILLLDTMAKLTTLLVAAFITAASTVTTNTALNPPLPDSALKQLLSHGKSCVSPTYSPTHPTHSRHPVRRSQTVLTGPSLLPTHLSLQCFHILLLEHPGRSRAPCLRRLRDQHARCRARRGYPESWRRAVSGAVRVCGAQWRVRISTFRTVVCVGLMI